MIVYIDTCCYGRPTDKQTQFDVVAETAAIKAIIEICQIAGDYKMNTTTAIRNPIELRKAGLQALNAALGPENTQTFLGQYHEQYVGRGDFTKERNELPELSNEEIVAGIKRLEEKNAEFIAAANAVWEEKMTAKKKMA